MIDKINKYFIDDELNKMYELNGILKNYAIDDDEKADLERQLNDLCYKVCERYVETNKDHGLKFFNDAKETIRSFDLNDYLKWVDDRLQGFDDEIKSELSETFSGVSMIRFFIFIQVEPILQVCDLFSAEWRKELEKWILSIAKKTCKEKQLHDEKNLRKVSLDYPDSYLKGTSKIEREIFNSGKTYEELNELETLVTPRKKKDVPYSVYGSIDVPEGLLPSNPFDCLILNAVISLTKNNPDKAFSAKQVAKFIIYGSDSGMRDNPSKNLVEDVEATIQKLRVELTSLDWTEHSRLNGLKDGVKHIKGRYMLPADEDKFIVRGRVVEGYSLIATPPLQVYSESVGHVATVPAKALRISEVNLTRQNLIIRDYLIERIEAMKTEKDLSRKVLIDAIIERLRLTNISRKKKKSIADACVEMLKYWTEINYIRGYSKEIKGSSKTLKSFVLDVPVRRKKLK